VFVLREQKSAIKLPNKEVIWKTEVKGQGKTNAGASRNDYPTKAEFKGSGAETRTGIRFREGGDVGGTFYGKN